MENEEYSEQIIVRVLDQKNNWIFFYLRWVFRELLPFIKTIS